MAALEFYQKCEKDIWHFIVRYWCTPIEKITIK
jgi:hypothetical protein